MKKLGQKASFLTKILLVVGLLISNLSSLSVVFAYEVPADVVIGLTDDELNVSYTQELDEEVSLYVDFGPPKLNTIIISNRNIQVPATITNFLFFITSHLLHIICLI